jgi:DNA-binding PadR family transcriptional regulator
MDRRNIILTAFAPADGASFTPVQVQKLLFLIDKEIPKLVGGPYFDFQPYYYGPFDASLYDELSMLESEGYVEVLPEQTWLSYRLTETGQKTGEELLNSLSPKAQEFIKTISAFVRSLSFSQLVSAIYKAYPEMKANSVFKECV